MLFEPVPYIELRTHQNEAVEALATAPDQFAYAEMAVASGKSLTMGALAARALPRTRVLIIAHTEELTKQNATACVQLGLKPAICCAALNETAVFAHLTVGTIGTIINRKEYFGDVGAILIDELHRARMEAYSDGGASQYLQLKQAFPNAWYRGFTATGWREDGTGSLENTFGRKVFNYDFADALQDGYVKPLRAIDADVPEFDTTGLKTNAQGEWTGKELGHRGILLAPVHVAAFLCGMRDEGRSRALVFACDVAHANALEHICRTVYGVDARAVHTGRDRQFRRQSVAAFRAGEYPVLISVAMFNTGFDVPDIDFMALCRPMKSAVLYAQSLGRGARLSQFANDCAVADFGGNIPRHGAIDMLAPPPRMVAAMQSTEPKEEHDKLPSLDDKLIGGDLRNKAYAGTLVAKGPKARWVLLTEQPIMLYGRNMWILKTDIGQVRWFSAHLPPNCVYAYAEHHPKYGWIAQGVVDSANNLHKT